VLNRTEIIEVAEKTGCQYLIATVNRLLEEGKLFEAYKVAEHGKDLLRQAVRYDVVSTVQACIEQGDVEKAQRAIAYGRDQTFPRIKQQIDNCIDRLPKTQQGRARELRDRWLQAGVDEVRAALTTLENYIIHER
jgi:hypothetical protein